jgi:hypothetical protein
MPFTHAQVSGHGNATTVGQTTLTLQFFSLITGGDVICVSILSFPSTITITSVQDTAGNSYIQSPHSPSAVNVGPAGYLYHFYRIVPAGIPLETERHITATFTALASGNGVSMFIDDFVVSGGDAEFDQDAAGNGTGTVVNTPTISPTSSGELLYAGASIATSITGVAGGWTENSTGPNATFGDDAAYILNASSSTSADFTTSGSGAWDSMMMAFLIPSGTAAITEESVSFLVNPCGNSTIGVW